MIEQKSDKMEEANPVHEREGSARDRHPKGRTQGGDPK